MSTTHRRIRVTEASGNVFADVGIEQPEEYLAKAELVPSALWPSWPLPPGSSREI
jgi:hypothetical protein